MTPEERDELIHFILQSQANAANRRDEDERKRDAEAQARAAELQAHERELQAHDLEMQSHHRELQAHTAQLQEQTRQIQSLAALGRDLVETARIQARRLDRLELNP